MSKIYASSLAGKEIVTVEGKVLGQIENIIVEPETGELVDLVAKPGSELSRSMYRGEGKHILIAFSAVCAVKDYIVVDDALARAR